MRILYLHQYFTTPGMVSDVSGLRSYELARRLVAKGHAVTMITACRKEGLFRRSYVTEEAGIRVYWIPAPYSNKMSPLRRMVAFIQFAMGASWRAARSEADVVFATSTPLTIAIPAIIGRRFRRRPMVFEVRDLWPDVAIEAGAIRGFVATRLAQWLEKLAYYNAREIVALAPGMAKAIAQRTSVNKLIHVIPNGCDLYMFDGRDGGIRKKYGWLGERPLVLYAGTLGFVNGVEYLADLAKAMRQISPEVRFAVVGDGRERGALERRAAAHGVLDRNLFLLGRLPKREAACWLMACDMTLSLIIDREPFWRNAVTNKFFDSLAAGRPIANNHLGWQTEIAIREGVGIHLPAGNPQRAAEELWAHLSDKAWMKVAGRRCRELAEQDFNRDSHALQLEAILTRSVSGPVDARGPES